MVPQAVRRAAGYAPGDVLSFQVTGPGVIEIVRLPRLTLEEALARYQITETVDGDRDWQEWEAAAAAEAIDMEPRGWLTPEAT
jgi:bifunctional DNA-binding transcriptional regulator/antitoxin component of YhaV-PrlF toxin-antitoxin module